MRNGTPGGNYSLVNETAVALDSDEWIIILGLKHTKKKKESVVSLVEKKQRGKMEHERGDRKYDRNSVRPSSRRSHERQQDIPSGIIIKKEPLSLERTKWDSGNEAQEYERKNDKKKAAKEKEKPNFALSGKLAEETNTFRGVVIRYSEPPEARIPKKRWRFYVFKDNENMPTLYMHRQSAYLIGRDRKVCDLAVDHPSCSKQHAALQYRLVPYEKADGRRARAVRPYIIDLGSSNETFVNNKPIEPQRYVELREKDVLKFGFSSREYVLLHDESKDDILDDDYQED
ncbi:smad nuclear-interacting protein 1-like [Artemia franciscana]|uniref:smad nuclear-interacting protein 1-like n=1 Tax=Artemia franciscana TaxID=6661 RepID=UPI0032DA48E3